MKTFGTAKEKRKTVENKYRAYMQSLSIWMMSFLTWIVQVQWLRDSFFLRMESIIFYFLYSFCFFWRCNFQFVFLYSVLFTLKFLHSFGSRSSVHTNRNHVFIWVSCYASITTFAFTLIKDFWLNDKWYAQFIFVSNVFFFSSSSFALLSLRTFDMKLRWKTAPNARIKNRNIQTFVATHLFLPNFNGTSTDEVSTWAQIKWKHAKILIKSYSCVLFSRLSFVQFLPF